MEAKYGEIKFRFGKYMGKSISDVPDDYLSFLMSKGILKGKMLVHSKIRLKVPKSLYRINVSDAVVGNGEYFVEDYSQKLALQRCMRENNIQCTQSFEGTSFDIKEVNEKPNTTV